MILKETILSVFNERATLLKWLKKVEALTLEIIERALLKPIDNPQSASLVAVDNTGAQVMLEVGAGLSVDNGVLKFADVYDGTVIIEKAESVLGLRRLKPSDELQIFITETIPSAASLYMEEVFNRGYFTVEASQNGETQTLKISPLNSVTFEDTGGTIQCVILESQYNETTTIYTPMTLDNLIEYGWFELDLNIVAFSNADVEQWLLANTEGVSV